MSLETSDTDGHLPPSTLTSRGQFNPAIPIIQAVFRLKNRKKLSKEQTSTHKYKIPNTKTLTKRLLFIQERNLTRLICPICTVTEVIIEALPGKALGSIFAPYSCTVEIF
jgi:hypothetical protein